MQFETIAKIISAIVAVAGVGKIIYDVTTGSESSLREDYKFAKEFLEDLKNNPDLHPFAVEKGYQAIAGSKFISAEEVAYLLSLKNPNKCLNDYLLSRKYLQKLDTDGDLHLAFCHKYSYPLSRNVRKSIFFTLYVCCALISILPIFMPQYFRFVVITLPGFGYYAFVSLDVYIRIYRGEQLVKNQQRHTSTLHPLPTSTFSYKKRDL
jgi:hypothetical protein